MKFTIKDFFSKWDQIRSHLLKKSLMENFIFCAVNDPWRSDAAQSWPKSQYFSLLTSLKFAITFVTFHNRANSGQNPSRHFLLTVFQRSDAVVRRCSAKKVFLEISQNLPENTCARVFSYEFCEIFKNNFFTEHLWTTAYVHRGDIVAEKKYS